MPHLVPIFTVIKKNIIIALFSLSNAFQNGMFCTQTKTAELTGSADELFFFVTVSSKNLVTLMTMLKKITART